MKTQTTKKGGFSFKAGVSGERQESEFGNATQTTLGQDERSISIAVTPHFPAGIDVLDPKAVKAFLKETMQPLVDAGFDVEIQYGRFSDL